MKEEITKKIRNYSDLTDNENKYKPKIMQSGKFIANDLNFHLRTLEKEE